MRREHKSAPRTRLMDQEYEVNKEKSHKRNDNVFIKSESSPQISIYIKSFLVQLGTRGIIPRKLCTKLINLLGLRGT